MNSAPSALFGTPDAVACERAVGELRAGRPVLLRDGNGEGLAVLALDSASPDSYAAFAQVSNHHHHLLLTPERAQASGLPATQTPWRLPLAGIGFEQLPALAWQRHAPAAAAQAQPSSSLALDAAAIELSRLSLLLPALVVTHVPHENPLWQQACALSLDSLAQAHSMTGNDYHIVVRTAVPLRDVGSSEFVVFRGGIAQRDQVAIVVGTPDFSHTVPVRVHSSCLTGDLFGSLKCDCGDQLRHGLIKLKDAGGGILLYLDQEGRGTGIAAKMRAYGYQHEGLDTIDADAQLGFGADGRRYEAAVSMLRLLGIQRIELLSNNPSKAERLAAAGITVTQCTAVTGEITEENEHYLRTKADRAGHLLDVDALIAAAQR